jgi:hypothetical protein
MYNKDYYLKNREKRLAYEKQRRKENPGARPHQALWNKANPCRYLLNNARSRASHAGLEFSITIEDITIPDVCPYLQVPIKLILGEGKQDFNISLDRIDSTKGYIKGNVQVISKKANTMKSNATKEELDTFARSIIALSTRA